MSSNILRIATRESVLALWQANYVKKLLALQYPKLSIKIVSMATQGDKQLQQSLSKEGGKGLFTKELEDALLDGRADIAVHSMKDVTMEMPQGLSIVAICQREIANDAFISNQYSALQDLPSGAIVGTSSLRRQCQIQALRPDLTIRPLRGNVLTRLQRLDKGDFDGIILAAAGLLRLDLEARIQHSFSTELLLPAVGQGALGIQCRVGHADCIARVAGLNHELTQICVTAERSMNYQLQGGCQVPVAGYAQIVDNCLELRGLVGKPDGSKLLTAQKKGAPEEAESLGKDVAHELLAQGAQEILRDFT